MASDRASTSGTVPETLPGFYSRRADSTETQQIQSEPVGPAQSFITVPKKEPVTNNTESLQHGKLLIHHIYSKIASYRYCKQVRGPFLKTLFRHFLSFTLTYISIKSRIWFQSVFEVKDNIQSFLNFIKSKN